MISWILIIVGGLNWLAFGLLGWDIGSLVGGMDSSIAKVIYILVGLAAIYEIITHRQNCKLCSGGAMM